MSHSDSASRILALRIPDEPPSLPVSAGEGDSNASPEALKPPSDSRSGAVFRQWLLSMATDAEAALAAAMSYREMSAEGRDQWLSYLESDVKHVDVPKIAIFAPLLAVEHDDRRRERILRTLDEDESTVESEQAAAIALVALGRDGGRIYVLSTPLYLNFVQVLACGVTGGRFVWVRHDPIVDKSTVPKPGQDWEGCRLESAPVKAVLDELAVAVLSHQRSGAALPEALAVLGELLGTWGP